MSKELDFDELDRAVNSLMGDVKKDDAKDTVEKAKTLDIHETLAPDEVPTYQNLDDAAGGIGSDTIDSSDTTVNLDIASSDESEKKYDSSDDKASLAKALNMAVDDAGQTESPTGSPVSPAPTASPSPKPTGRFMDVVHPSSDMLHKPTHVSHVGKTLGDASLAEEKPQSNDAVADSESSEDDAASAKPEVTTEGNLPDTAEVDTDASEEKDSSTEPAPEVPYSPFVPDVKVEKRPLGGDGMASDDKNDTSTDAADKKDTKAAESSLEKTSDGENRKKDDEYSRMDAMMNPKKPEADVTQHIPEEFNNDLLEVEKNATEPTVEHHGVAEPEIESTDKQDAEDTTDDEKIPEIASIPKQYKEKPSTGDETSGSIYDTKNYHKPLEHTAKQKSGWLWVLFIVVFILAGGALGAAAYFFGLI